MSGAPRSFLAPLKQQQAFRVVGMYAVTGCFRFPIESDWNPALTGDDVGEGDAGLTASRIPVQAGNDLFMTADAWLMRCRRVSQHADAEE